MLTVTIPQDATSTLFFSTVKKIMNSPEMKTRVGMGETESLLCSLAGPNHPTCPATQMPDGRATVVSTEGKITGLRGRQDGDVVFFKSANEKI